MSGATPLVVTLVFVIAAVACGSSGATIAPSSNVDAGGGGDSDADVVQPPAGCDPKAEPKNAPKCVVSEFGVFVDATNG